MPVVRELINKIGFKVDDAQLRAAEHAVQNLAGKMDRLGKRLTLFVTAPIVGIGIASIKAAADVEQLSVAFTTMLGSAEAADRMIRDIQEFAATTPFQIGDVERGAKSLLAYGIEQEKIIPTMRSLGDVSAGLGVEIDRIILNYGQVRAQSKLTGRELRDFAIAGVPLLAVLAKQLNKTESQIQDMVSAGKISFAEVEKAFQGMSGEGGKFANLMEKQSKTIGGLFSNFLDVLSISRREIGKVIVEALDLKKKLESLINAVQKIVKRFQEMDDGQKKLILGMFGIAAAVGPVLIGLAALLKLVFFIKGAFALATIPVLGFHGALLLVPAAILALIAAIVLLVDDFLIFKKGGDSLIGTLFKTFEGLGEGLSQVFDGIKKIFGGFMEFIFGVFTSDNVRAVEGIKTIWSGLKEFFLGFWDGVGESLSRGIQTIFKSIAETVLTGLIQLTNAVNTFFSALTGGKIQFGTFDPKQVIESLKKSALFEGAFDPAVVGGPGYDYMAAARNYARSYAESKQPANVSNTRMVANINVDASGTGMTPGTISAAVREGVEQGLGNAAREISANNPIVE